MKLRVLLSIFFIIATSFTAIHEVQHFVDGDDTPCMVCHVNDNLTSADAMIKNIDNSTLSFINGIIAYTF